MNVVQSSVVVTNIALCHVKTKSSTRQLLLVDKFFDLGVRPESLAKALEPPISTQPIVEESIKLSLVLKQPSCSRTK